jgi:deoxyribonuclease V
MDWPDSLEKAKNIQNRLQQKIRIIPLRKKIRLIAGVDAAFSEDNVIGTACLYTYPEMDRIEDAYEVKKIIFPYIPGFLSFREGPAVTGALKKLTAKPDLVLFDGQGIAHPSHIGIATHMGILLNTLYATEIQRGKCRNCVKDKEKC